MVYGDNEGVFSKSFLSFIAGSLIGAGVALLYAPQSGERTREEIKEKAERTIVQMQKVEEEIKNSVNQLIVDVKSKVNQLVEEGRSIADDKKQDLFVAIESGKKVLEEQKDRLKCN